MRVGFLITLLVISCLSASAQDKPLTNSDVVEMSKAGLSPDIIVKKIQNSKCDFVTGTIDLVELKTKGVPDAVVTAMLEWKAPAAEPTKTDSEKAKSEGTLAAADKTISALRRLDNAISNVVTFQNYSSLLIESKSVIDENLKDISDLEFRSEAAQSLFDHQYAMAVWSLAATNGWAVFFTKQEPGRTLVTRYGVPVKISIWTEIPVMTGLRYVWLSSQRHFNNADNRLRVLKEQQREKPTEIEKQKNEPKANRLNGKVR